VGGKGGLVYKWMQCFKNRTKQNGSPVELWTNTIYGSVIWAIRPPFCVRLSSLKLVNHESEVLCHVPCPVLFFKMNLFHLFQ
jgi:hypothetical protein